MVQSVEEWYKALPVITRSYLTLAFITTVGCALEIISPLNIYFNPKLIFQGEAWRLITTFLYFGTLGLDFVFHMFFLVKYSKSLEEGSFRGKSADFLWMLLFGGVLLLCMAPFVDVPFLGAPLSFMMVYVWGRRHPYVNLSFLGIFNFTAPYLPWVLLAFTFILGSSPLGDVMGMCVGHLYYFLEDVYPRMTGRRPLKTPSLLLALFPHDEALRAPSGPGGEGEAPAGGAFAMAPEEHPQPMPFADGGNDAAANGRMEHAHQD